MRNAVVQPSGSANDPNKRTPMSAAGVAWATPGQSRAFPLWLVSKTGLSALLDARNSEGL